MKDYAAMSDQQINQLVGCKIGELQLGARGACCIGSDGNALVLKGGMWQVFDPCNNPADAWPIIQANGICIGYDGMSWDASCHLQNIGPISDWKSHPEKPLRMAMIVFLMMKEGE